VHGHRSITSTAVYTAPAPNRAGFGHLSAEYTAQSEDCPNPSDPATRFVG
jgi:hypothetical protein